MTNPPGAMPPLPERDGWAPAMKSDVYMPAKMHAYAKAYAAPLIARVAELEADAARYRWLRHGDNDELILKMYTHPEVVPHCPMYLPRVERLDAAIDAAIAAKD